MAQSVDHLNLTLDFGLGHDPRVMGLSPVSGSELSMEPAKDSLFLSSVPLPCSRSLSLSLRKKKNHQNKVKIPEHGAILPCESYANHLQ